MSAAPVAISFADVRRAAGRLEGIAHRTPVLRARSLDRLLDLGDAGGVFLKCETFQRGGAFKFRGAFNAISALAPPALARGVCAVSSGNHAQAVALAARLCGTSAVILMPADAPALKRAATEGYGAEIVQFDRYNEDREALLRALALQRGREIVHPFDNPLVMAGQGTVALELTEQVSEALDVVVVPVGGGGLLAGCATAVREVWPAARMVGVEPEASDDVARSMASGRRERVEVGRTIADGQQTAAPGELTWPVIQELVDEVVTVSDEQIIAAMRLLFERLKLVVEPSGATGLAALLCGRVACAGRRVGVVLSGGNVGADAFGALMAR